MGLFGFGKKRLEKNVTRDNVFLKTYASKVNGLLIYAEGNEKITAELNQLQKKFQYTTPSFDHDAKAIEKNIAAEFKKLTEAIGQPSWAEDEVSFIIKGLIRYINEISSLRE